ncbi:hypothetical protein M422DRAFT_262265 [Sphaerobolus stellatus SS14]|uniref:Uncharacterized protein n=1 Tax=Sphaerobolus stellatus (strain SS14) TaxID=990650 RepID=A0A0C9UKU6_SPHS4|nr:hypothetical protein M422DRAFT_262265 [Sphaerobolus stellatus SS14]
MAPGGESSSHPSGPPITTTPAAPPPNQPNEPGLTLEALHQQISSIQASLASFTLAFDNASKAANVNSASQPTVSPSVTYQQPVPPFLQQQTSPVHGSSAPLPSTHILQPVQPVELASFIPPISHNPAAGMSFDRMFHNVDLALRLAIAKHEFRPEQIWKLDSLAKERSKSKSFELDDDGSWTKKEKAATSKDYPTQRSLFDPLTCYFQMVQLYILYSAGINSAGQVIFALGEYLRQLQNLAAEYKWNAVLRYHFEFHSI